MQLFRDGHPEDFTERHAGMIVSMALAVALGAVLATVVVAPPRVAARPPQMTIRLQPPAQPLVAPLDEQQLLELAAAASRNPSDTADFNPDAAEGGAQAVSTIESWRPSTPADFAALRRLQEGILNEADALEARQSALAIGVMERSVESVGREFLLNSDGGREGVLRFIDVSGFPDDVVRQVCRRYGISVKFDYVTPSAGGSWISGARTSSGEFGAAREPGFYHVFQLSDKSVAMMTAIEVQALTKADCRPGKCRVRQITFGIVMDDEGHYALGVTDLQVEELR